MMKYLENTYLQIALCMSAISGLSTAVILNVPPEEPPGMYRCWIPLASIAFFLLVVRKNSVQKISTEKISKRVVTWMIVLFVLYIVYHNLYNICVFESVRGDKILTPLWADGHFKDMLERYESSMAKAYEAHGIGGVKRAIDFSPQFGLNLTKTLFLFLYAAAYFIPTVIFALLGIKYANREAHTTTGLEKVDFEVDVTLK